MNHFESLKEINKWITFTEDHVRLLTTVALNRGKWVTGRHI